MTDDEARVAALRAEMDAEHRAAPVRVGASGDFRDRMGFVPENAPEVVAAKLVRIDQMVAHAKAECRSTQGRVMTAAEVEEFRRQAGQLVSSPVVLGSAPTDSYEIARQQSWDVQTVNRRAPGVDRLGVAVMWANGAVVPGSDPEIVAAVRRAEADYRQRAADFEARPKLYPGSNGVAGPSDE